jgi:23S rRNA G2069 N7-methylase RlmK/C1962 C5-methylase RlmI
VLDTFCYSGGFGISAALQGASAVDCVDSSAPALALAERNGELNGVRDKLELIKSDVGDFLDESVRQGKQWDRIVLDPPKLAPRRDDLERAKGKYKRLNKAALQCVRPGGLLLSCTCSSAMAQTDELLPVIREAAAEAGRQITVVRTFGAACDHPVSPSFPEGRYLAAYLVAVN